jgi:hypothetical protein
MKVREVIEGVGWSVVKEVRVWWVARVHRLATAARVVV